MGGGIQCEQRQILDLELWVTFRDYRVQIKLFHGVSGLDNLTSFEYNLVVMWQRQI